MGKSTQGGKRKARRKGQDEKNSEAEARVLPEPGVSRHRRRVHLLLRGECGGLGYENIAENFPIPFHWPFVFTSSCLCKRAAESPGRSWGQAYGCLHGSLAPSSCVVQAGLCLSSSDRAESLFSSHWDLVLFLRHSTGELLAWAVPGQELSLCSCREQRLWRFSAGKQAGGAKEGTQTVLLVFIFW